MPEPIAKSAIISLKGQRGDNMVNEADLGREKYLKKERNRRIRNGIILAVIIFLALGVVRACMMATHNQKELENKSIPIPTFSPPPTISKPW